MDSFKEFLLTEAPLLTVKRAISTVAEIKSALMELSKTHGGAWVPVILPFHRPGEEMKFNKFSSPSKIPDEYIDDLQHRGDFVGYKGKIVSFSKGAIIRNSYKGLTRD